MVEPTAAGQGHRQPMRRTRLALPWGMRTDLRTANSDLIVLRGLIFKAILVESEVLDAQDTGRFLMALAAASGTSFAVATAVASAFLQVLGETWAQSTRGRPRAGRRATEASGRTT